MAVSPLVMHPTDALQNLRSASSPLKNANSTQASSNGTPLAQPIAPNVSADATMPASLDLAEQLNEEEKRKYVKGSSSNALD